MNRIISRIRETVSRAMSKSAKVAGIGLAAAVIVGAILLPMVEAEKKLGDACKKRVDLYGDPLPAGAVARLGTQRLRHQSQVVSVAFSPDSKLVASASVDKAVIVCETATGKVRHRLVGHTHSIYSMAFSRDGKMLASGSRNNGQVILWDAVAGRQVRELARKSVVYWVAFSPDGKVLLSVSDRGVHLWDVATGEEKRGIEERGVYWAEFTPDGKEIAFNSRRGEGVWSVRLWDVAAGKEIRSFEWTKIKSLALSPDGGALAARKGDGSVRVWDVRTGKTMVDFPSLAGGATWNAGMVFSPDSRLLASVGDSNMSRQIRILSLKSGKEVMSCKGHLAGAPSIAFSPDGKMLASGGWRGRVRLWDVATGDEIVKVTSHFGAVRSVAFVPDGRYVITKSMDGTIRFWDVGTSVQHNLVRSYWGWGVSPDGRLIASLTGNHSIRLADMKTGQALHILAGHECFVEHFAFAADGKKLASLDRRGELRVWDVAGGKQIVEFDSEVSGVIIFSPDGKTLASGGEPGGVRVSREGGSQGKDSPIRLWDATTGEELAKFGTGDDPVSSLAFSADGRLLASGHGVVDRGGGTTGGPASHTVRVWDVKTGKGVANFEGHTEAVSSVAFSGDGAIVASGSMDGTVRLWEVSSGKEIVKLEGHGLRTLKGIGYDAVYSVTFSPDGKVLASGSRDGTVLFWDVKAVTKSRSTKAGRESIGQTCKPSVDVDVEVKKD